MRDNSEELKNDDLINPKKLTEWANEPTIIDFQNDYRAALPYKDEQVSKIAEWLDYLHITGKTKRRKIKGRSSITPKLIRKQAEWRYASLSEPFLDNTDIFTISPVTYEDKDAAIQNEQILNNQFNTKIDKVKFIDDFVRTVVDEGTAILRVYWETEYTPVVEPVFEAIPTDSLDVLQQLEIIKSKLGEDPNFLATLNPEVVQAYKLSIKSGIPYEVVQTGEQTINKLTKNQPGIEVVDYSNIIIDPTAMGDMDKANFVIYSFETSLADLEKDGKYSNLEYINIENSSILSDPDHNVIDKSNFNFTDKARKKFIAYEYWGYWDIEGDGVLQPIVATYVDNTLIRLEENPYPDRKVPFVAVQYLPVRKSMYGEPDSELLKDNQDIIGAVTRGMIDIMGRSANGQTGRRKDMLDIANRYKYENGDDYEYNPGTDPRQGFFQHTYPEIPQSAQYMIAAQNAEAESLSGVRAFAQSSTGNIGADTAAGVRSATDAASKRELGILRRFSSGIIRMGRKIIAMNAVFLNEKEIVRITNDEFVKIRRDDLAGNFDLRLSITTAEANNAKAEELSFMLQTTAQSMGIEMTQSILAEIARLRKMPDFAKRIENFKPTPDPLAEEEAGLRIELLQAQIKNELAKANENNANAALDNAKAENIGSDTDLKNLNFLEQESGVTQERGLQSLSEQAKSNIDLEESKLNNKIKERIILGQ